MVWWPFLAESLANGTVTHFRCGPVTTMLHLRLLRSCNCQRRNRSLGTKFSNGAFSSMSFRRRLWGFWAVRVLDVCFLGCWRRGAAENTRPTWPFLFGRNPPRIKSIRLLFGLDWGLGWLAAWLSKCPPEQRRVLIAWGASWRPVLLSRPAAVWPSLPGCFPSASCICCVWTSPWPSGRSGTQPSSTFLTWTRPPRSRTRRKRSAAATGNTRPRGTLKA